MQHSDMAKLQMDELHEGYAQKNRIDVGAVMKAGVVTYVLVQMGTSYRCIWGSWPDDCMKQTSKEEVGVNKQITS